MNIRHDQDAAGPLLLGRQCLAQQGGRLAHDQAVEGALGIVFARLVSEGQDNLVTYVRVPIVVVTALRVADAEAGEGQESCRTSAQGLKGSGTKSWPARNRRMTPPLEI